MRRWALAALLLVACEQQKIPPLSGLPPARAADEEMAAAFAPGTVTVLSAPRRTMPRATRQVTLDDGSVVVALYDRDRVGSDEADLPPGAPLVFAVRPDGTVEALACPATLIARTSEARLPPAIVPLGAAAALLYRSEFPNDRPTVFIADVAAGQVIETPRSAALLGRGATADRLVLHEGLSGQAKIVRWDGQALVDVGSAAVSSGAEYVDEPSEGVVAWLEPLRYRRSDRDEAVPVPTALFSGQPFDGALVVRREPSGSLLFRTASGVSRWAVEGDRSLVELAPNAAFSPGFAPSPDSDFGRTTALKLVNNPYQANLTTPGGQAVRVLTDGAFVVSEVTASPCGDEARCGRVGETFLRDVVGAAGNARAVQLFYPWIEGAEQRLVLTPAMLRAIDQGAGGQPGGGAGGTGGGAGVGGAGGGAGGAAGAPTQTCPDACPKACDASGLCSPQLVDAGPISALSASRTGDVAVLRAGAVGVIRSAQPSVIAPVFDAFVAATSPSVGLRDDDLYVATSTGTQWHEVAGSMGATFTPAGARVVGVTATHVYTAAPFGVALAVQRNVRPHGAAEMVACLPQATGPTRALVVRDGDGSVLVGRGGQVFRYDGVAGGACETAPDGTLVLALAGGMVERLAEDGGRLFVAGSDGGVVVGIGDGATPLALPPARDLPPALAARGGSVFYVQASGVPGLAPSQPALVENADGVIRPLAIVPAGIGSLAVTDEQVYWIDAGGALYRVPR
ncbi:MAG: hypothetical protein IT374_27685 [Polyangiaceae bacterium]|nr:hypothetical protein [Polyangiaceae bacterium]